MDGLFHQMHNNLESIERLALFDAVTALPNRTHFRRASERMLGELPSPDDAPGTLADEALAMGFHISFSGILTFKTAEDLRDVARSVSLDRLLIETDCPYLAPLPHRGKRNEPAFVVHTAERLAEVKGVSTEEIAQVTSANFRRLFRLG